MNDKPHMQALRSDIFGGGGGGGGGGEEPNKSHHVHVCDVRWNQLAVEPCYYKYTV